MKIKQLFIQLTLGMLLLLSACQNEVIPEQTGDKVALSFNLYRGELTKAANATTLLPDGSKIRAYAYTKGAVTTGSPVSYGDYVVDASGKATALKENEVDKGLTLYRGNYDIYLVSYNDKNYVPETANDNLLHVSNGNDFMYSTLKGITVQPTSGGANTMSVDLPEPFTRLCSQVIVTVKAGEGTQPVPFTYLVVTSVNVNKLSDDLSYQMGTTSWVDENVAQIDKKETISEFTNNTGGNITTARKSEPLVVLPLTGNNPLEFEINLNIGFNPDNNYVVKSFTYNTKVYKSFLPGMTYRFDFTLTFFGDQKPTDLSLAILEYTTVKISTDDVGK